MASQSYITAAEYAEITGREASQATEARLRRASMLLDARIGPGYTYDETTGRKLDRSALALAKADAVTEWTAWMVAALYDNADSPAVAESLMLGRFQVQTPSTGTREVLTIPDSLRFADAALVAASVIRRSVRLLRRNDIDCDDFYSI